MNPFQITFIKAFTDNYIWVFFDETNRRALCVDPGESAPLLAFLKENKLTLSTILLTHHHNDHVAGVSRLLEKFPEAIIYGVNDTRLQFLAKPILSDVSFSIDDLRFETLKTAGHTNSHVCFLEKQLGLVLTGDTLFSAGCGRIFDGSADCLFQSLQRLRALPDETKVYCGHEYTRKNLQFAAQVEPDNLYIREYLQTLQRDPNKPSLPSSIALEKQINPFFRLHEPAVIQYAQLQGQKDLSPFAIFKKLRSDKDIF